VKSLALLIVLASRVAFAQSAVPNTWRYDATIDNAPATVTIWEGGSEVFAGTPAFRIETVTISADGDKRVDERMYLQKGTGGLAMIGTRTANSVGGAISIEERVAVSPATFLPAPFDVGAKWDTTTNVRASTTTGGTAPAGTTVAVHVVGEVIGRETITVPAGEFECFVIRETQTTPDAVIATSSWYAPKVGLVKATTTTTRNSHESTRTLQLRTYRVPRAPWEMASVGLVPAGEPAPSDPAPTEPAVAAEQPAPAPAPPSDNKREKRKGLARRLVVTGSLIVVAGGALGLLASSEWNTAQQDCGGNIKMCSSAMQVSQAQIDKDAASSYANFATGFIIAGAIVGGAGIYLYATLPSEKVQIAPSVTANAAGLTLSGRW